MLILIGQVHLLKLGT